MHSASNPTPCGIPAIYELQEITILPMDVVDDAPPIETAMHTDGDEPGLARHHSTPVIRFRCNFPARPNSWYSSEYRNSHAPTRQATMIATAKKMSLPSMDSPKASCAQKGKHPSGRKIPQ
jgi:hypothetical protein